MAPLAGPKHPLQIPLHLPLHPRCTCNATLQRHPATPPLHVALPFRSAPATGWWSGRNAKEVGLFPSGAGFKRLEHLQRHPATGHPRRRSV